MDRIAVEVMSKVCQKLAIAKTEFYQFAKSNPENYMKLRDILHDCEELMAIYCDCAPIKLINGQINEIIENK